MDVEQNVGGRDRRARAIGALVLAIVAVLALRRGRKRRAAVAGVAAVGLAINAASCYCGVNRALGVDTTEA